MAVVSRAKLKVLAVENEALYRSADMDSVYGAHVLSGALRFNQRHSTFSVSTDSLSSAAILK